MSAKELKSYLSSEAESGSFAGGIAAIAHAGMVKSKLAFGYACLKPEKKPVTGKTIYDLASLTKPLVTTLIILYLIQSRLLSMDSKLGRIFGSCPADKKDVTIKNLLCHSSGIQSWFPLYTCSKNLSGYSSEILKLP